MTLKNEFCSQLRTVYVELQKLSLSYDDNFPAIIWNKLEWTWNKGISYTLKNMDYVVIYNAIKEKRDYNFLLFDGGIIQIMYEFDTKTGDIIQHRLAFYPNPELPSFWNFPEDYDDEIMFSENIYATPMIVPVRFDFCREDHIFTEHEHSYSHVTLWWYKNCRITNAGPITPLMFLEFILKSFYFEKYKEHFLWTTFFSSPLCVNYTITADEKKKIHFNIT